MCEDFTLQPASMPALDLPTRAAPQASETPLQATLQAYHEGRVDVEEKRKEDDENQPTRKETMRNDRRKGKPHKGVVSRHFIELTKSLIICPASRMVANVRSGVSRTSPALVKLDGSELLPSPQLRQGAAW